MAQASAWRWLNADSASAGCRKTSLTSAGVSPAFSSWPRIWPCAELPLPTAMDLPRQLGDRCDRRIGVHQNLVADSATVVRRDHLDLGACGRTEDRRGVAGDGEVDLAGGGGLDLRRSGGERGELHLVGQVVELTGGPQQRLGAALLVADLQGQSGQVRQRHGRPAAGRRPGRSAATRSRRADGRSINSTDECGDGERSTGVRASKFPSSNDSVGFPAQNRTPSRSSSSTR